MENGLNKLIDLTDLVKLGIPKKYIGLNSYELSLSLIKDNELSEQEKNEMLINIKKLENEKIEEIIRSLIYLFLGKEDKIKEIEHFAKNSYGSYISLESISLVDGSTDLEIYYKKFLFKNDLIQDDLKNKIGKLVYYRFIYFHLLEDEKVERSLADAKKIAKIRESLSGKKIPISKNGDSGPEFKPLDYYNNLFSKAIDKLRLKNGNSGLIEIPSGIPTLVVSDLHARVNFFENVINFRIVDFNNKTVEELLSEGKINLVFVGDYFHSEHQRYWDLLIYEVDSETHDVMLDNYGKPVLSDYGNFLLDIGKKLPGSIFQRFNGNLKKIEEYIFHNYDYFSFIIKSIEKLQQITPKNIYEDYKDNSSQELKLTSFGIALKKFLDGLPKEVSTKFDNSLEKLSKNLENFKSSIHSKYIYFSEIISKINKMRETHFESEMKRNLNVIDLVFSLSNKYENVFLCRGNHDFLKGSNVFKFGDEGHRTFDFILNRFGSNFLDLFDLSIRELGWVSVQRGENPLIVIHSFGKFDGTFEKFLNLNGIKNRNDEKALKAAVWSSNISLDDTILFLYFSHLCKQFGLDNSKTRIVFGHRRVASGSTYRSQLGGHLIQVNHPIDYLVSLVLPSGEVTCFNLRGDSNFKKSEKVPLIKIGVS